MEKIKGKVISVNISSRKGMRKKPVKEAELLQTMASKMTPMPQVHGTGRLAFWLSKA